MRWRLPWARYWPPPLKDKSPIQPEDLAGLSCEEGALGRLVSHDPATDKWTLRTGHAVYWSRSRQRLWRKGEESGNQQRVHEIRTDCITTTSCTSRFPSAGQQRETLSPKKKKKR